MYIEKINDISIGGKRFDGSWVSSNLSLASNLSIAASVTGYYSLESYLPNDGYDYEVMVSGTGWTGSTSGNAVAFVFSGGHLTENIHWKRFARCNTRTANNHGDYYSGTVAVPAFDRYLSYFNQDSSGTGSMYLGVIGYRRIGKAGGKYGLYAINDIPFGGSAFDGQFVFSNYNFFNGVTLAPGGSLELDLTDILPKDDFVYNAWLNLGATTASSSGNNVRLTCSGGVLPSQNVLVAFTRSNSTEQQDKEVVIPVSINRKITFNSTTSGSGNATIYGTLNAYRRVGSNE